MYIIVMSEDKSLVASKRIKLYEGDNLADKLIFLLPQTYKEIELSECIVRLNYIGLNGEEISETLVKDEELYKDRLCYRYPVDSRFTEYYRDIVYDISFSVSQDMDGDGRDDKVLFHTKNHTIRILPRPDSIVHEEVIPEDAAGKLQKDMLELEHRISDLEEKGIDVDVKDVVKYTEQTLTDEEKKQARKNIDVMSQDDTLNIFYNLTRDFGEDLDLIVRNMDNMSNNISNMSHTVNYMYDQMLLYEIEETLDLPDVTISCNDDGNGNVSVEFTGVEITDDGNGNIGIESECVTVTDDFGNIEINL